MTVGDILQIRFACICFSQNGINVLHAKVVATGGTGTDEQGMANSLDAFYAPLYKALLVNSATYWGAEVRKLLPAPGSQPFNAVTNRGIGTAGANALPGQTAGLSQLRTAAGGRTGRGRIFVPFPSVTDNQAGGNPTAGYKTRLGGLTSTFLSTFTGGVAPNTNDIVFGLFNRKTLAFTVLTNQFPTSQWWSQRRREFGRKPDLPPWP